MDGWKSVKLIRKYAKCKKCGSDPLANVKDMADKQLNQELAELTSYEGMDQYDEPCYTYEPAASLEIQEKAIKSDPNGYVKNLANVVETNIFWDGMEGNMSPEGISWLLDVTPRQRAEAAYMTLREARVRS